MIAARTFLFDAFLAALTAVMGVLMLPALADRRAARAATRLWAKIALGGLNLICGIRHQVSGAAHIPTGPAIVIVNHQSMWETIALLALLERPAIVFKKELKRIPVYGWWASRTGVPVDRSAGARAVRMLRRETERHIARGDQIVVFPEGTRGAPGALGPLQPGVAGMYLIADTQAVPAVHNSGTRWRHPGGRKTPGRIDIRFLPPIAPGLQKRAFMRRLEEAMRDGLMIEKTT
ncbi:MAG: lysophospholipid acyltransferase family protein [Parvularculaceae bacterium]|nr:1-acyl-sn-glycerol-3-phosphate acyltransferase [Parvularculaceae bacterium]